MNIKGKNLTPGGQGDKEELLLMIQMNGQKGVVKYNQVDISLMNVLAKIAASALLKIKAERVASD